MSNSVLTTVNNNGFQLGENFMKEEYPVVEAHADSKPTYHQIQKMSSSLVCSSSSLITLAVLLVIYASSVHAKPSCIETLKKYPSPDASFQPNHLETNCPELCRNSSGYFSTGQFPHPWNCNSFINCHKDDAWVHYCQTGLQFNEKNGQCDWPRDAKCVQKSVPVIAQPTPQIPPQTTPSSAQIRLEPQRTCISSDPQFNLVEDLGDRKDLCKDGTGLYSAPDCRFYIRCNGTYAVAAKCPAGFVFDGVNRRCDWPQKVPSCLQLCGEFFENPRVQVDPVPTTTPSSRLSEPISTRITPIQALPTQSPTTTTTTTTTTTPKPTTTQPPHDPLCLNSSGTFEYPNLCSKYVKCVNWHADLQDCPAGLVFVLEKGWCNWTWMLPENHKCYKPFDDGTTDCPFTRDSNDTSSQISQIVAPATAIATKIGY